MDNNLETDSGRRRPLRPYPYAVSAGPPDISLSAPVVFRGDLYGCIEQAARAGFDAAELHLRTPDLVDAGRMREWLDRTGMSISVVATGLGFLADKLSLIDDSAEVRRQAAERLRAHIVAASRLKCGIVIGTMRGNIPDFRRYSEYERRLVEGLKSLAELAEAKDVPLYLEAINRYEINYLHSVGETLEVVDKVGSGRLKVHIDTFHMNIEEGDLIQSIVDAKDRIGYVHISDSNRKYPGAGHIDFRGIVQTLKRTGYRGYLAVEILPLPNPAEAAERSVKALDDILFSP